MKAWADDEWEDEFCPICDEDIQYLSCCNNPDCPNWAEFERREEDETDIYH